HRVPSGSTLDGKRKERDHERDRPRLPRGATPTMYRDPLTRERCAEHDLALGPGGECVLCRRGRARPAHQRWLGPAVAAASLGTLLLGGVALARTRVPASVQATREVAALAPVPAAMVME